MKDIKIKDAAYFPRPQAIYKALPIARTMGEAAAEYMAGWEFNGLIILASAGEYDDKKAVFVLPEKEKHVNIHNYCLHLFYSAANPLPDFTGGSGSI